MLSFIIRNFPVHKIKIHSQASYESSMILFLSCFVAFVVGVQLAAMVFQIRLCAFARVARCVTFVATVVGVTLVRPVVPV